METVITGYLSGPDWTLESPKTFVVLGSQRSGTSFLSNALRDSGVYFGQRGWRMENGRIVLLNRDIIQAAGGNWMNPPPEPALLAQGALHAVEIAENIEYMRSQGHPLWGWKDPRQALTIRSYLDFLDGDVYLIAIFRRPEQVGASLERKGMMSKAAGVNLAKEYARRIISAIRDFAGLDL